MCARPRSIRGARALKRHYVLFSGDESRGLREIRQDVTLTQAYVNLATGIWRERYDDDGYFLGFQIRTAQEIAEELLSRQTSVSISANEMQRNAGRAFSGGESRTAHLSEDQRLNRAKLPNGRRLPPEDSVERLAAKIKAHERPASRVSSDPGSPLGDRAVRVYPNG